MHQIRWHPLLGEWVIVASHRLGRTLLPPKEHCPFCPTKDPKKPTEVPEPDFEVVVFENRFPSLSERAKGPSVDKGVFKARKGLGICEVVLYTPQHEGALYDLPEEQVYKLVKVWTDRYAELGAKPFVKYVFIFENRGEAVGVTLHHPHGQIYAYPFIPPLIRREIQSMRRYWRRRGRCLLCEISEQEAQDGRRMVFENESFRAYVPFFARWTYEVHIVPKRHVTSMAELTEDEQFDLALALREMVWRYDNLFGFPLPYMMVMHQAPTDGRAHPYYHYHIEFYTPHRARDKLKFLAGSESGAGVFINDTAPEEKAQELREAGRKEGVGK